MYIWKETHQCFCFIHFLPLSCMTSTRRLCSVGTSSCRVWVSRLAFSRSCGARRGLCWSRSRSISNRPYYCSASSCAASSNSGGWAARRTRSGKMCWRYEWAERKQSPVFVTLLSASIADCLCCWHLILTKISIYLCVRNQYTIFIVFFI